MMIVDGGAAPEADRAEENALREYYKHTDFLFSAEGILKIVSVIACIAVSVFYMGSGGGGCGRAPPLPATAAVVALVAAGAAALLYAGTALQLPLCAPQLWLFMDIIVSTILGVLLLVMAILNLVFCESESVVDFLRTPVGMVAAALVVGSVGVTFAEVTRRWDAARPAREPPRPAPLEHDV